MKKKSGIMFAVSALIIVLAAYVLIAGVNLGNYQINSLPKMLTLGLDLKGGVYIEEEIVGGKADKEAIDKTVELIALRVNGLGVSEPYIAALPNTNRIRIEMPGIYDAYGALEQIGKTGELTFVDPEGKVVINGSDVKEATVGTDTQTGGIVVNLSLKEEGAKKFYEATKNNIGKVIKICMDGEAVSEPTVNSAIPDGEAQISGQSTIEEAKRLAGIINSGSLPVTLKPAAVKTIGPSLGAEAIPTSVKATLVGIALVMLFMLLYYKVPGIIANLALAVYILLSLSIFIGLKAVLTLPGIAGFLLTIGMAVDANVLIFERIKEELKNGKSISSAVDNGFHRAFSSIIDSNVTTLIAGFALYFFGTGTIKGFALTLNIGVLCSMFTAVVVTRFLLRAFVNSGWVKNKNWFMPAAK